MMKQTVYVSLDDMQPQHQPDLQNDSEHGKKGKNKLHWANIIELPQLIIHFFTVYKSSPCAYKAGIEALASFHIL